MFISFLGILVADTRNQSWLALGVSGENDALGRRRTGENQQFFRPFGYYVRKSASLRRERGVSNRLKPPA